MRPSPSIIVTTYNQPHTLRLVLLACARQTLPPAEVLVADDGSDESTRQELQRLAPRLTFPLRHVFQPDNGFRAARSRNNAIHLCRPGLIAFLDQDTLPRPDWLQTYADRILPGRLGLGRLLEMDRQGAAPPSEADIDSGAFIDMVSGKEQRKLRERHRRFRFYARLRAVGFGVKNKPKLRSCNFALHREDLLRVNGFDEEFTGWGQEDDDLGRRLFAMKVKPVVLLQEAVVYHLPHQRRSRAVWRDGGNIPLLEDHSRPAFCRRGLDHHPHPDVQVTNFPPGKGAGGSE